MNDCRLPDDLFRVEDPLTSAPPAHKLAWHNSDLPRRSHENTENVGSYLRDGSLQQLQRANATTTRGCDYGGLLR